MADLRVPYNNAYCAVIKCPERSGNLCKKSYCVRNGNEKRAAYYTTHHKLADGDIPNA